MKIETIRHETEIAEIAKIFLELNNWEIYPEVVIDMFNGRPDYVCVKNESLCQVVECKKTLSYPVIEQLARWQIDAEKRRQWDRDGYEQKIAIPHLLVAFVGKNNGGMSDLKKRILEQYRIGVFSISKSKKIRTREKNDNSHVYAHSDDQWSLVLGDFEYTIKQEVAPKIQIGSRQTAHKIIRALNVDMRCATAGAKSGETDYMTPFKRTMNRVKSVLSDGKEHHIKNIVNEIKPLGGHHYCSDSVAMSSISVFIDKFGIADRSREYGPWFVIRNEKSNG